MHLIISFLLLTFSIPSFAQDSDWEQLFKSTFYSENFYESSQCNMNVRRYLRQAKKNGMNISKIEVIELVNKGFSTFGMVAAQNSRGHSEMDHTSNWFHHVFLKSGNTILDYDFTMKPSPTELTQYFRSMYLTERTKKDMVRCLDDIGRYQITIFSGSDYLKYYDDKVHSETLPKKKFYLKDVNWACQ